MAGLHRFGQVRFVTSCISGRVLFPAHEPAICPSPVPSDNRPLRTENLADRAATRGRSTCLLPRSARLSRVRTPADCLAAVSRSPPPPCPAPPWQQSRRRQAGPRPALRARPPVRARPRSPAVSVDAVTRPMPIRRPAGEPPPARRRSAHAARRPQRQRGRAPLPALLGPLAR